jgi:hypothetical protein
MGRLGDDGALVLKSIDGDLRECVGCPKSFLEAMVRARLSALAAAREAILDGEDDNDGGAGTETGVGGKVIWFVVTGSLGDTGDCGVSLVYSYREGGFRSCNGRLGCSVSSVK